MKNLERSGWGESTEHPAASAHAPSAPRIAFIFIAVTFPYPARIVRGPGRPDCAADSRRIRRSSARSHSSESRVRLRRTASGDSGFSVCCRLTSAARVYFIVLGFVGALSNVGDQRTDLCVGVVEQSAGQGKGLIQVATVPLSDFSVSLSSGEPARVLIELAASVIDATSAWKSILSNLSECVSQALLQLLQVGLNGRISR